MRNQSTLCEQRVLDNGIEEYVLLEGSRAAVDQYVDAIAEQWQRAQDEAILHRHVLVDLRQAQDLPIVYTYNRFQHLLRIYSEYAPVRVAYLYNQGFLYKVAQTLVILLRLRLYDIRFFAHREQAVQWLLSEDIS